MDLEYSDLKQSLVLLKIPLISLNLHLYWGYTCDVFN